MRTIVPLVGLMAAVNSVTAMETVKPAAGSEWLKPEIRFGGSVEAIADVGNDAQREDPTTTVREDGPYADFAGVADLYLDARFNDQVGGHVELWMVPFSQFNDDFSLREGYIALAQGDWSARLGKNMRRLGLLSPRQDQLLSVFDSTIGYAGATGPFATDGGIFGTDTIGAQVTWQARDQPLVVTGMLNNGFWAGSDSGSGTRPSNARERDDLGYGVDASYAPNRTVTVDGQIAFEPHTSYQPFSSTYPFGITRGGTLRFPAGETGYDHPLIDRGGPGLFLDLNTTIKPEAVRPLTLSAELVRFTVGNGYNAGDKVSGSGYERWQGLVMGNWAFERARFPMSVTGMIQSIHDRSVVDDAHAQGWEYSASLLTQPFDRIPLHLDAEVAYQTITTQSSNDSHGIELAGRALLTF